MGYNLKPLDLQGAIGIEQVLKFDEIEQKRKISKTKIEEIFLKNIEGVSGVKTLKKSDVSWFGTPFICENYELKTKLVKYLEDNKIQTRNYFAGNILLHPGFQFLDDYSKYPESNKVLDKVFFVGAAPHYNDNIFKYIEEIVKNFKL
jgi:CDP-6-deoxy-D-xylo-4-hexulose-3-dehydrase